MFCSEAKTLTARKQHVCHSCGEDIFPGEQYKRWLCVNDGSASTVKMHPECYEAHCADTPCYGAFWEFTPFSYPRGTVE